MLDAAEGRDRAFGIDDLVADESDAEDRYGAALQGFDRKQRVIDRAEPGRSTENERELPLGDEVDLQQLASQRHIQPTRQFDHQRGRQLVRPQLCRFNLNVVELRGNVR